MVTFFSSVVSLLVQGTLTLSVVDPAGASKTFSSERALRDLDVRQQQILKYLERDRSRRSERPDGRFAMPVIKPDPDVQYFIHAVPPEPGVDYKLHILRPAR